MVDYSVHVPSKSDLTEAVLRKLYTEEQLTEAEIAERFSTHQVAIGRLRTSWGIPTVSKSDRLKLPGFNQVQTSLLLGSMFGDGGLKATGSTTARLEESHADAQRAYLDWKAVLWGPYVATIIPTKKQGSYPGWRLITHGCREFRPYWEGFYPGGLGDKRFDHLSLASFDDLSLAVWFMDDGSRSSESFRFHVSPYAENQRVQLQILRKFGLHPRTYPGDGDTTIHISGRGDITRFIDLVAPHVPESMNYKLSPQNIRVRGIPPREKLTSERLTELVSRGLNTQQMADVLKVGTSSVRRALLKNNVLYTPVCGRPPKKVGFTVEGAHEVLNQPGLPVERILDVLRQIPIPIPQRGVVELDQDIARLRKCPTLFSGEEFTSISYAGSWLCDHCFPYRYDARYKGLPSLREAWYEPKLVERAIRFQRRVGDPTVPKRVLRALQLVVHAPTNFRPSLAKALIQHYLPQGGLVLDPCAGYGGRAAGAWAAGCRYVGVEPHPQASEAYRRLSELLGGGGITLHSGAFEDVDLGPLLADLAFTSPPYFSVERYSDDTSQSWVRYPTWDGWIRGFLIPLVTKCWQHLRPGGRFILNTKNLTRGRYPILDVAKVEAQKIGFELEWDGTIPLGRIGKDAMTEPLLVYVRS